MRQARIVAEQREAEAVEKQVQTEAAIAANSEQLNVLTNNRTTLVAQRDEAERNLAIARAQADNLQGQRAEYEEFQQAEQARIQAEAEAQAAAEEKRRADEAAAQAAAEAQEAAQQAQAAEEAQAAQAAQAQAAQAAQAEANDRAAAQQRAAEAQAAAEQAQREADAQAANDAQAQALREQALTAASIAAAALIAASQSSHATTQNPYPTDEDADPTDIADIQGPTQPGTGESGDSQNNSSDNDSTGSDSSDSDSSGNDSSEVISGDRSAQIETVIARAMSQLGVQYAWGGGNANGPTLGIRDGGVADSYGDYNKVGFDCSGLTLYAFAGVGISLPHYTGYQYQHGTKVSPSEMQRGDLIFYGPGASQHVAIYLGDGQMIEAPNSGSVVKISPVRWSGMTESVVRLI